LPVNARAYRRKNGKKAAICWDTDIENPPAIVSTGHNACLAKKFPVLLERYPQNRVEIRQNGLGLRLMGGRIGGYSRFGVGDVMATDGKPQKPDQTKGTAPIRDGNVVSLGRDIQVKIGQHLRTMYDEVVKQGVPDQFNELLQKLDHSADKKDGDKDSHK
jgi:hypothetical protein